jgi:GNAT superfamily N-acetyltransferase
MDGDIEIRAGGRADPEAIMLVHVAAIIAGGPAAYSDRQVAAWAAKTDGTDRYEDSLADPTTDVLVAEAGDRVVGFGELDVAQGEIEAVFVDPAYSGRGIGSALLARFERRLREAGFDRARLRAVLNAVGFYEDRGYERVERVTTTTTAGVEVESVWMERPL